MIKYFDTFIDLDLTAPGILLRINTVNCVGAMGKGIALEFKQRYPEMFKQYQKDCEAKLYQPGHPKVWLDPVKGDTIINFPTKDHWRDNSQYEWIETGLQWLAEYLTNHHVGSYIDVPPLGCGNGGLSWVRVSALITHYLKAVPCHTMVYSPPEYHNMKGYLTCVGSQSTPPDILEIMYRLGVAFVQRGWCIRSGAAKGADSAFQAGAESVMGYHPASSEIYVCSPSRMRRGAQNYYLGQDLVTWDKAAELAGEIHPAWSMMQNKVAAGDPKDVEKYTYFMALHTRNMFQVLGASLNLPSKALYCWAPPQGSGVKGGTNVAWQAAKRAGIPTYNLHDDETREKVLTWLEAHEAQVKAKAT